MRGWLAVRLEGDFTERDEANLPAPGVTHFDSLDALAQLHLPECRAKVADPGQ